MSGEPKCVVTYCCTEILQILSSLVFTIPKMAKCIYKCKHILKKKQYSKNIHLETFGAQQ